MDIFSKSGQKFEFYFKDHALPWLKEMYQTIYHESLKYPSVKPEVFNSQKPFAHRMNHLLPEHLQQTSDLDLDNSMSADEYKMLIKETVNGLIYCITHPILHGDELPDNFAALGHAALPHIIDANSYLLGLVLRHFLKVLQDTSMGPRTSQIREKTAPKIPLLEQRLKFYELHANPDEIRRVKETLERMSVLKDKPSPAQVLNEEISLNFTSKEAITALALLHKNKKEMQGVDEKIQQLDKRNDEIRTYLEHPIDKEESASKLAEEMQMLSDFLESMRSERERVRIHHENIKVLPDTVYNSEYIKLLTDPTAADEEIKRAWQHLFDPANDPVIEVIKTTVIKDNNEVMLRQFDEAISALANQIQQLQGRKETVEKMAQLDSLSQDAAIIRANIARKQQEYNRLDDELQQLSSEKEEDKNTDELRVCRNAISVLKWQRSNDQGLFIPELIKKNRLVQLLRCQADSSKMALIDEAFSARETNQDWQEQPSTRSSRKKKTPTMLDGKVDDILTLIKERLQTIDRQNKRIISVRETLAVTSKEIDAATRDLSNTELQITINNFNGLKDQYANQNNNLNKIIDEIKSRVGQFNYYNLQNHLEEMDGLIRGGRKAIKDFGDNTIYQKIQEAKKAIDNSLALYNKLNGNLLDEAINPYRERIAAVNLELQKIEEGYQAIVQDIEYINDWAKYLESLHTSEHLRLLSNPVNTTENKSNNVEITDAMEVNKYNSAFTEFEITDVCKLIRKLETASQCVFFANKGITRNIIKGLQDLLIDSTKKPADIVRLIERLEADTKIPAGKYSTHTANILATLKTNHTRSCFSNNELKEIYLEINRLKMKLDSAWHPNKKLIGDTITALTKLATDSKDEYAEASKLIEQFDKMLLKGSHNTIKNMLDRFSHHHKASPC